MAAVDCAVRYTQTGESPGNAYGNSPLSSNGAVLYYRDLDEGTMWGEYDILSAITIYPKAGLTGKSGVIFGSSGSVTT